MGSPESSREQSMSEAVENAKREVGFLLNDVKEGDWIEVSALELEQKMDAAKDGLTGANIDEILSIVAEAEVLYKAAKEKSEVPEDRIKMIDQKFEDLKIS